MKRLILLSLTLLASCAGPSINTAERNCGGSDRPFPEAWPCTKAALSAGRQTDLKRYYIATGDVVAEQISSGQITEAQGRQVMAKTASDIRTTALARYNGDSGSGVAVYQRVGPGTVVRY
jgi:hypothetical protein